MSAQAAYEERMAAAKAELARLDRRGATLANLRTVTFLGALLVAGLVVFERLPRPALVGAVALLAAYVVLAVIHARVINREERTRVVELLNRRGLDRLAGTWTAFAARGAAPEGHLYAFDLDVVGQGSLFQRLDETGTRQGEQRLLSWLLEPPPPGSAGEIAARQDAVKELTPRVDFRQALIVEARSAARDRADPTRFVEWAESPSRLDPIRWAFPLAHLLPPVTIVSGLLTANGVDVAAPAFWLGLFAQVAIIVLTRRPIDATWSAITLSEKGFVRFEETFAAIDRERFSTPLLGSLKGGLAPSGPPVSARLKRFARLLGFAELKHSGQMHPIINALTLWDILVLFRLDRWRATEGQGARGWFEALAQLEALSAMATYAFERPEHVFPVVTDAPVQVEAHMVGHPLLEAPVRNDVTLDGPGSALIITGSNMSGKTTLMRAVGLNVVMGLAGLPVCATAMRVSVARVMTSMRVKDSLERGVSYFYAEVQRIRLLLETAAAHRDGCLFFLDELFMGTNTRERQIASQRLLGLLLEHGAAGAVTTHDLSLTELATGSARVVNVHFRDHIEAGEMVFDYRLRPGVVQTTNALEVLRRAGVPV